MSKYEKLEPVFAELDSGDEHIHPMFNTEFDTLDEPPRRKTPFLVIGSLLILAFAGGGLVFAYKQGVREGNRTAPPIIKASTKPIKTAPKKPGGIKIPNQNKRVYDRLDEKPVKLTERLMPSAEEIMDLPKKPVVERAAPENPKDLLEKPETAAVDAGAPENSAIANNTDNTAPLPTHEVDVFTITPDGVFSGSAAPAASNPGQDVEKRVAETKVASQPAPIVPPVEAKKTVPPVLPRELPRPPVQIGELPDTEDGRPLTERLLETEKRLTRRSDEVSTTDTGPATGTAERVVAGSALNSSRKPDPSSAGGKDADRSMRVAALPPVPRRKPARLSTPLPSAVVQPVKTTPVTPQKRTLPALGRGRFVVQIASHRRQADALAEFAGLKRRYPQVIGNYKPSIQRADLGDRGIYYRLRIGPLASKADAARFCESLKTAGKNDCLIRRR